MNYYTFTVTRTMIPLIEKGKPIPAIGDEYGGGKIVGGDPEFGFQVRLTKTVEAVNQREGWKLTGWPAELKRSSTMALAKINTYLYDESQNELKLAYTDEPEKLAGARLFRYEIVDKFIGITINTKYLPVYFILVGDVTRAYQRPKSIDTSPEDFYDATQWQSAMEIFKNTTPMLEKITQIIWAAAGLLSLMVLFMLIFAKGV